MRWTFVLGAAGRREGNRRRDAFHDVASSRLGHDEINFFSE
jgi:hypothetical protein